MFIKISGRRGLQQIQVQILVLLHRRMVFAKFIKLSKLPFIPLLSGNDNTYFIELSVLLEGKTSIKCTE